MWGQTGKAGTLSWPLLTSLQPRLLPRDLDVHARKCPGRRSIQTMLKDHLPLTMAHTHVVAPPHSDTGTCEVRNRALVMNKACLRERIFTVRTGVDGDALLMREPRWGPWGMRGRVEPPLFFQTISLASSLEARSWMRGTWLFAQPRLAFSSQNIYHALDEFQEMDEFARRANTQLASVDALVTLNNRPPLLNGTLFGALLELALPSPAIFHLPPAPWATTLCFETVILEIDRNGSAAATLCAQGLHGTRRKLSRAVEDDNFNAVKRAAYARLHLRGSPPRVASGFERAHVLIVHRLRSRRLENMPFLAHALLRSGIQVTIAALECLDLAAQIVLVSRSSTLIGAHGAALALGRFLPDDGAIIELRSTPCVEADISWMGFRSRFAVLGAPSEATVPDLRCPLWRAKTGVPFIADVAQTLNAVHALDPLACRCKRCRRVLTNCAVFHEPGAPWRTRAGELRPGVPLLRAAAQQAGLLGINDTISTISLPSRPQLDTGAGSRDVVPYHLRMHPWYAWDVCRRMMTR